jgi:hypothetical protein
MSQRGATTWNSPRIIPIALQLKPVCSVYRSFNRRRKFKHPYANFNVEVVQTAGSKAWTVLSRSNSWAVRSNPTRGMSVLVCFFRWWRHEWSWGLIVLWSTGWGVLPVYMGLRKWRSFQGTRKDMIK